MWTLVAQAVQNTTATTEWTSPNTMVQGGAFALMAWVVWYTHAKAIPRIVTEFRHETKDQREWMTSILEKYDGLATSAIAEAAATVDTLAKLSAALDLVTFRLSHDMAEKNQDASGSGIRKRSQSS